MFREAHAQDARHVERQPFDDYWSWVKTFLVTGGAGQRSWLAQADAIVARVRDAGAARALRDRVHALGKAIAAEWAKPARYRRIHSTFFQGSPNLQAWGRRLEQAAARDAGDGKAIREAVEAIEREVDETLRRT